MDVSHWRRRRVQGDAAADRRHAVRLPRAQHHLRARCGYRRRALALRSAAQGLESRIHDDVSRRHLFQGAGAARRMSRKNSHGHDRRATDRRRCEDRQALHRLRHERRSDAAGRHGRREARLLLRDLTADARERRRGARRLGRRQRRSGRTLRRHPRLRSDQRPLAVGLGSRTSRRAHRAARRPDVHARHAERVERLQRRRCARPRLHSDRQRDAGLLRRPSQPGVRALRELGRRARCRNRRGALVVPDDASRHLGLRRAVATGARRSTCRGRQRDAGAGRADQARRVVPARSSRRQTAGGRSKNGQCRRPTCRTRGPRRRSRSRSACRRSATIS